MNQPGLTLPPESFAGDDAVGRLPSLLDTLAELQAERERLREEIEQRRQAELLLRAMFEGVKEYAILMLDSAGRVATWNAGASQVSSGKSVSATFM